uniref:Ig-like domain-containing protein n=1 Tax=Anopheles maculatus TaxID=74869 RepID=A0A182T200_9DIPT
MWKHYAASYDWEPMNVFPQDFTTDDPDKPYGSVLMLTDASADQVGRYYCVDRNLYDEKHGTTHEEDEAEEEEDPNRTAADEMLDEMVAEYSASAVYVYVDDPEYPLVPVHTPVFRVEQYQDFIIPCKPTHPNVEVELYKDLEGPQYFNTTYDSANGFTVRHQRLDTGVAKFICRVMNSAPSINQTLYVPIDLSAVDDRAWDLVEDYQYSNTQGFLLSFNRLEDGGSYYCQVKDKPHHRIHFEIAIDEHCEFSTTVIRMLTRTVRPPDRSQGITSNALYLAGDGATSSSSHYDYEPFSDDQNTGNSLDQVFTLHSVLFADQPAPIASEESLQTSYDSVRGFSQLESSATAKLLKRSIVDQFKNSSENSSSTLEIGTSEDPLPYSSSTEGNSTLFDNFTYAYDYLDVDTSNGTVAGTSVGYANATEDRPTTPRTTHVHPHGANSSHVPLTSTSERNYYIYIYFLLPICCTMLLCVRCIIRLIVLISLVPFQASTFSILISLNLFLLAQPMTVNCMH